MRIVSPNRIATALLLTGLVAIGLLSSGLSDLRFKPGEPFPLPVASISAGAPGVPPLGNLDPLSALRGILAIVLVVLMIYVPARLISLIDVRKIIGPLLLLAAVLLLAISVPDIPVGRPVHRPLSSSGGFTSPSGDAVAPLGLAPVALVWLVGIALVTAAGVLVFRALRPPATDLAHQLGSHAETALTSLRRGADPAEVISYCYVMMNRCIEKKYDLRREQHMTVREYESWLQERGLPAAPLLHLGRLFEKLRYGRQQVDRTEQRLAIESLGQIMRFCLRGST